MELAKQIEEMVKDLQKEPQTPFRDVAIGGLHSAINGLEIAERNLEWHAAHLAKQAAKATESTPAK